MYHFFVFTQMENIHQTSATRRTKSDIQVVCDKLNRWAWPERGPDSYQFFLFFVFLEKSELLRALCTSRERFFIPAIDGTNPVVHLCQLCRVQHGQDTPLLSWKETRLSRVVARARVRPHTDALRFERTAPGCAVCFGSQFRVGACSTESRTSKKKTPGVLDIL